MLDAWNTGSGPDESTLGILEVDAFPDDAGCQLASHARGGVCDARTVLPTSLDEPFCTTDEIDDALPASGRLTVGNASDLIPLCDGWMLAAEEEQLALRNGLDGRSVRAFDLGRFSACPLALRPPGAPGRSRPVNWPTTPRRTRSSR